jgi:hypothetical protein
MVLMWIGYHKILNLFKISKLTGSQAYTNTSAKEYHCQFDSTLFTSVVSTIMMIDINVNIVSIQIEISTLHRFMVSYYKELKGK